MSDARPTLFDIIAEHHERQRRRRRERWLKVAAGAVLVLVLFGLCWLFSSGDVVQAAKVTAALIAYPLIIIGLAALTHRWFGGARW